MTIVLRLFYLFSDLEDFKRVGAVWKAQKLFERDLHSYINKYPKKYCKI
jgi:hypothetical protein